MKTNKKNKLSLSAVDFTGKEDNAQEKLNPKTNKSKPVKELNQVKKDNITDFNLYKKMVERNQLSSQVLLYNREFEYAVISAMINNVENRETCLIALDSKYFYYNKVKILFDVIKTMAEQNKPIDLISITEELKHNILNEELTIIDINDIAGSLFVSKDILHICKVIINYARLRAIRIFCYQTDLDVQEQGVNADAVLNKMDEMVYDMIKQDKIYDIESNEINFQKEVENVLGGEKTSPPMPTGYRLLDKYTGGHKKKRLDIIAGRPSMGKTASALNKIRRALINGYDVGLVSIEMSKEENVNRFIAMECKVDLTRIDNDCLTKEDLDKITKQKNILSTYKGKLHLIDNLVELDDIISWMKKLRREKDVEIFYIDYIQLMSNKKDNRSREGEISSITRRLKQFAKTEDVSMTGLSQLNRAPENRSDKEPRLSDLRESGAIEQDADTVMFIFRPDVEDEPRVGDWLLLKQRNGPTGRITIDFKTEFQTIAEVD